jgi:hypothetical protein
MAGKGWVNRNGWTGIVGQGRLDTDRDGWKGLDEQEWLDRDGWAGIAGH